MELCCSPARGGAGVGRRERPERVVGGESVMDSFIKALSEFCCQSLAANVADGLNLLPKPFGSTSLLY